MSNFVQKMTLS